MDGSDRLYHRLLRALDLETGGEPRSVTIAEIYQHLVPYRAVRTDLGFGELPEYEHALLRMLAGGRHPLHVEHDQVREELQRELRSNHPIVGIYRDYAAVKVRVDPAGMPAPPPVPERTDPAPPPRQAVRPPAAAPSPRPRASAAPAAPAVSAGRCGLCEQPLPAGEGVRFCPFCGGAARPVPCGECGEELRPGWRFCAACGRPRDRGAPGR
jgi:hypothetical protein